MRRRARLFRRARIGVLAAVIAYFFLPYEVRAAIPVWLLFLAALGLEVEFFLGGYLKARRGEVAVSTPDRGPQERDLTDLGIWAWWDRGAAAALPETPRFQWRHVAEAVAVVALVAGILFYASRPQGWDAVGSDARARTENVLSREASLIAGHPARIGCDASGDYVGFVQDADGLAFVGGDQAYLTPAICNTLYQLAVKHRTQSFSQTARAIAVLATRVVAPPRRAGRGAHQLLRVPERRRDRGQPRPLREHRAGDDAGAARDERVRLQRQLAVPRAQRVPRRGRSRPESGQNELPVVGEPA